MILYYGSCRVTKWLLLACTVVILLVTGCGKSTGGNSSNTSESTTEQGITAKESEQAREAAVKMLTAMKERNVEQVVELFYSKCGQRLIVIRKGRENVDANVKYYELDSMTDKEIDAAVKVVPDADQELLVDMVRFELSSNISDTWDHSKLKFLAVKYAIPTGETILAPMVKEDGKWKMSGFSVCRTGILKYKKVDDAIKARDNTAVPL